MKKFILAAAFAVLGVTAVNAQSTGNFKLGAHVGIPVGDAADGISFNLGADVAYVWNIAPNFELGIASGYSNYFGKDYTYSFNGVSYTVDGGNLGIIPLAATGQYNMDGGITLGADLGYAFYIADGADGGAFYYQPKVGYNIGSGNVYLGYKGLSDNGTISSINLGYIHKF